MELWIFSTICLVLFYGFVRYCKTKVRKLIPQDMDDIFRRISKLKRDMKNFKIFNKNMIFIRNPQIIHKVFSSDVFLERPNILYKNAGIKYGLINEEYSIWRHDRRHFNVSFSLSMVQSFLPTFCRMADRTVARIAKNHLDGKMFDMLQYTEGCGIEMIFSTSFGIVEEDVADFDMDEWIARIATRIKIASGLHARRFQNLLWFFDSIYKFSPLFRREVKERDEIFKILMEMFEKKREEKKIHNKSDNQLENTFINRLFTLQDQISFQHFRDHIFVMVGSGFETTGTAVAHCILFLATNPEVQEKAYQEIMKFYPTDDTEITYKSLLELDYVERVMKESLRLGPSIHAMAREALEHFELEPDKIIEKGSIVFVDVFGQHRRKDLWGEDAESFDPDRFLPENYGDRQNCYIPFGIGRRNCIGYRYAPVSFKIQLIKYLRNFQFSSTLKYEEIKFNRQIALKLVGPHLVSVKKRI